jgi:hypothetical protein
VTVKFPLILSRCRKLYQQLNSLPWYPLQLEGHHRGIQYQTYKNKMQLQCQIECEWPGQPCSYIFFENKRKTIKRTSPRYKIIKLYAYLCSMIIPSKIRWNKT